MEKEKLVQTVKLAQCGSSSALNDLFNAYYNDVYYFALKTVKDADLACEITQETFVEIINTLDKLKEPAAFVTWMKQITYHQCTRYFKKKKEVLVDENEDGDSIFDVMVEERTEFIPDEAVDQADFRATIMAMIDELSDEQRTATMMYYFDELSIREIAKAQGVSENTVKGRLRYAKKALRQSVEDYEKKNNIKLHSLGILPLLLWLYQDFSRTMPAAAAKGVARSVSAASGIGICAEVGAATAATATTTVTTTVATASATTATAMSAGAAVPGAAAAATGAAAKAAVGLGAKIAALPIATKITAAVVATAVTAGAGTTVFVSNSNPNPTEATVPAAHIHSYVSDVTPASCQQKGQKVYTCDCGDSYTEELAATGHQYNQQTTPSTCLQAGQITYTCQCGDTYSEQLEIAEHYWGHWRIHQPSTPIAAGEERRYCADCDTYETRIIEPVQEENTFYNPNNNIIDEGKVSIRPRYVYWEDGNLIAECFVINGLGTTVSNINVKNLSLSNDVAIAAASFGVLEDLVLPPNTHAVWKFVFLSDSIQNYGDLSALRTEYKTTYVP